MNIVPFEKPSKPTHNQDIDVLYDPAVRRMISDFWFCGDFRSLCDVGNAGSYAEQICHNKSELQGYGLFSPVYLVQPGMISDQRFVQLVTNSPMAGSMIRIFSCGWFNDLDVSPGLLQMLFGNNTDRCQGKVKNVLDKLVAIGAITETSRSMAQPFHPKGISFSAKESKIFIPTRKTLYRVIEVVMFLIDRVQSLPDHHKCMVEWTGKPWPKIERSIGCCYSHNDLGEEKIHERE